MVEAVERILDYTASHSLETFVNDQRTVDAVVRNMEVIGEAARHVDDVTAARCPDVPWADIRDMRNLLIHEYFGVSVAIVWETVTRDLPRLGASLRQALGSWGPSENQLPE
jgi:uncharacterized protein with HEPN domain